MKTFITVLAVVLSGQFSVAQIPNVNVATKPDSVVMTSVTSETLQKMVQSMGFECTRGKNEKGKDDAYFSFRAEGYKVVAFDTDPRYVQLYVGFTDVHPKLAVVNEWNQQNSFTRSSIDKDGNAVLETELILDGGVTRQNVETFIKTFRDSVSRWARYVLDHEKDAAPAPVAAVQNEISSPAQLKAMADKEAAPLIEQLKSKPNDLSLNSQLGNIYYDAQVFPVAIEYYQKALAIDPKNAAIRTDMATAMFYANDPDHAITEFNRALKDDPKNSNALFNRGIVKWKGKADVNGAVTDWEMLLKQDPNYEKADKARTYLAQAKQQQANLKPTPPWPRVGAVEKGYRFKGGDPAEEKNWEKVTPE